MKFEETMRTILPVIRRAFSDNKKLSREDKEDLTQQVLMKVWNAIDLSCSVGSIQGYSWRAAKNVLNDLLRAKYRTPRTLSLDTASDTVIGADEEDTPFRCEDLAFVEAEQEIYSRSFWQFDELTPQVRETLEYLANDSDYEQIARKTGANIGTVRSRIHYARKKLAPKLEQVR